DVFPDALGEAGIAYEHMPELGGLRRRQRDIAAEINAFWDNESFHNYADYAMTQTFRRGLVRLRELGAAARCAIMCSEVLWWRCHRRIIADYLMHEGATVFHILAKNHV